MNDPSKHVGNFGYTSATESLQINQKFHTSATTFTCNIMVINLLSVSDNKNIVRAQIIVFIKIMLGAQKDSVNVLRNRILTKADQ
jgi:hypothetical protein